MVVKLAGSWIDLSLRQLRNILSEILVQELGRLTSWSFSHAENAPKPTSVTESGVVSEESCLQFLKTQLPILVKVTGSLMEVIFLQSSNK